jgi:protein-S-isoprenylcysteine O-methyltransferase Ste14
MTNFILSMLLTLVSAVCIWLWSGWGLVVAIPLIGLCILQGRNNEKIHAT